MNPGDLSLLVGLHPTHTQKGRWQFLEPTPMADTFNQDSQTDANKPIPLVFTLIKIELENYRNPGISATGKFLSFTKLTKQGEAGKQMRWKGEIVNTDKQKASRKGYKSFTCTAGH